MEEISNKFFVSKKEDIDKFIQQFMSENSCCDRAEIKDVNDSWEVIFFKKQEKKVEVKHMAFKDIFQQAADEMESQINDVKKQAEEAKKSMEEQTKKARAEMEAQLKTIQEQAKQKLASMDDLITKKNKELEDKISKQISSINESTIKILATIERVKGAMNG